MDFLLSSWNGLAPGNNLNVQRKNNGKINCSILIHTMRHSIVIKLDPQQYTNMSESAEQNVEKQMQRLICAWVC